MRLLVISHEATRTGAPYALLKELQALKEKLDSLSVDILLLKDGPLREDISRYGRVFYFNLAAYLHRLLRFFRIEDKYTLYTRLARKGKYDLMYANTVASLDIAVAIKRRVHVPLLARVHESDYLVHSFHISSQMLSECDSIVAVSEISKKNLVDNYGVHSNRVVIQHPISPHIVPVLNDCSCEEKLDQHRTLRLGMSGSHGWVKSMELIPLLVKTIHDKYPELDFELVGIGLGDRDLQYRILFDLNRMGLSGYVKLHGVVDNPIDWFKQFDVFLMLSREDSFPLAVEENAALAKPIIAFDNATGANEWLTQDSAYIVPYMDLEAVSDAIYSVYSNEKEAVGKGKNAHAIIRKMYHDDSKLLVIVSEILKYSPDIC